MKKNEDKIEYIEDDIQKVQLKTGMYISYVGKKGALHLCKEIINNAIDESINPKSKCDLIEIDYYVDEDRLTVIDNGRGISEDEYPLDIVCTKLNSGSKFTREQGGGTAGENGVGLTAVNALSEFFSLSSKRKGKDAHRIVFNEGIKVEDENYKAAMKHGTIVSFSPSKKYLGSSASIPFEELNTWVKMISYLIPSNLTITLTKYEDMVKSKVISSEKYKSKTIKDLLKDNITKDTTVTDKFSFITNTNLIENFQDRQIERELQLQFAFAYTNITESYIESYCNFINTIDGGIHLDAVRESILRFFTTATKSSLTDKEKTKMDILWVDVETGLNLVVNISTTMQMQFASQTKEKISNEELFNPIKSLATECLTNYFKDNKDKLDKIVKFIKLNAKARIEMNKVKSGLVKERTNVYAEHLMKNFTQANNRGAKQYREIFIVEGDSAKGTAVTGRDPATQAFFAMRGLTANAFTKDLSTIMANKEWHDLVKVLNCQIGKQFDINKLRYEKIIILTDADIDGYGITSYISAFFVKYLPEIVKAGKLYKVVSPLYLIENGKFINTKADYVALYRDNIKNHYKVSVIDKNGDRNEMTGKYYNDFLLDVADYPNTLLNIADFFGINKFLLEYIVCLINYFDGNVKSYPRSIDELLKEDKFREFMNGSVQQQFPEITFRGKNALRGVIDGRYQSITLNERFIRKTDELFRIFDKYGYTLHVKEKGSSSKSEDMSIGKFLDKTKVYVPEIKVRFKGLGESDANELWDTTLNPNTRTLIQLTFDDIQRDLEVFGKLHGGSKQQKELRKMMMNGYKVHKDDLDN